MSIGQSERCACQYYLLLKQQEPPRAKGRKRLCQEIAKKRRRTITLKGPDFKCYFKGAADGLPKTSRGEHK